jgi:hypothetical protein
MDVEVSNEEAFILWRLWWDGACDYPQGLDEGLGEVESLIRKELVEEFGSWHAIHGTMKMVRLTSLGVMALDKLSPLKRVLSAARDDPPEGLALAVLLRGWIDELTVEQLPEVLASDLVVVRRLAKERLEALS